MDQTCLLKLNYLKKKKKSLVRHLSLLSLSPAIALTEEAIRPYFWYSHSYSGVERPQGVPIPWHFTYFSRILIRGLGINIENLKSVRVSPNPNTQYELLVFNYCGS